MKKKKKLNNQEMIQFCEHMSMILKAGLTPAAGIDLMLDDTTSEDGRNILLPISEKCNEGYSFPEALKASEVFPDYALNLIEIGNASGKLDEVMDSLAYHYSREEALAQGIKSAVTYPFLIIIMMLVVVIVLIIKVLPIFQQVFVQLGTELTGFSASLLHLGTTLSNYSILFISILAIAVAAFLFFTKSSKGKKALSKICAKFVLTKSFFEKIAIARFSSGMGITIAAGLDFEKSLDLVENLVENEKMKIKIDKCRKLMEGDGENIPLSFSKALVESNIYNNVDSKMISIGFSTGSVEEVFHKISANYDAQIERTMNTTVSILEPALVIMLSIVVCLILLSVIMPLMGVMSSIG